MGGYVPTVCSIVDLYYQQTTMICISCINISYVVSSTVCVKVEKQSEGAQDKWRRSAKILGGTPNGMFLCKMSPQDGPDVCHSKGSSTFTFHICTVMHVY